jgi:hypothetical protein
MEGRHDRRTDGGERLWSWELLFDLAGSFGQRLSLCGRLRHCLRTSVCVPSIQSPREARTI